MKLIYKEDQNQALNQILIIFAALTKHEDIESTDAIIATFKIARIVGGDKMIKKLEGKSDENSNYNRSIAYRGITGWTKNVHRRAGKVLRRHKSIRRKHG